MEPSSERDTEDYSSEPSVSYMETWLEWQAKQLGTPAWWTELQAILGIRDPQKLAWKIRASFYIPDIRIVKEYVTRNYLDIIQDPGMTEKESPSHEPQPPFLAVCCHHQRRNKSSGELLPTLLPLPLKGIWPNILPHQPEQGGRTLVCYL